MPIIVTKNSEKILIWLHRNNIKSSEVAKKANITPAAFSIQMKKETFSEDVMNALRSMGYKE